MLVVNELSVLLIGLIAVTGLIAAIIEVLLKKWFGNQLKRGLLTYDGGPPKGPRLWERVYWQYEQRPRFVGALLETPTVIWCAVTVAFVSPFDLWQTHSVPFLVLYSTLVTVLFPGYPWAKGLWHYRRIQAEVEYIRTKEELDRSEEML